MLNDSVNDQTQSKPAHSFWNSVTPEDDTTQDTSAPDNASHQDVAQPEEEPEEEPEVESEPEPEEEPEVESEPEPEVEADPEANPLPQHASKGPAPVRLQKPKKQPERRTDQPKKTVTPDRKTPQNSVRRKQQPPQREHAPQTAEQSDQRPKGDNVLMKLQDVWAQHHKKILIGIAALACVAIYVAGGIFFSSHFLPRTTVNGNDVSMMSHKDFSEYMGQKARNYQTKVTGEGVDLSFAGNDVELKLDLQSYTSAAVEQVPAWLWPISIFSSHVYDVNRGISFNQSKLNKLVTGSVAKANEGSTPSTNAFAAYDDEAGGFVTVPEKLGTEVDPSLTLKKVTTEVEGLRDNIEISEAQLVQPAVVADNPEFKKAYSELKSFPELSIDLILDDEAIMTLDPNLIRTWLVIGKDYRVTGDLAAITAYTKGTLSEQIDSVGASRTYDRPDGKTVSVSDGTYGWTIDGAKLAEIIVKRIDEKSSEQIEIPTISNAATYNPGGADWGDRYIDVDLTEQYARMYDAGSLVWESDCVSGGSENNNETVTGVFYIYQMLSPTTLIGSDNDGDGEPDYINDVNFWMPFYGGYGLHDATWRYSFGGSEFLYDGSHGCVNLPYDKAELLFYTVEVGDPVIVHW